MANWENVPVLVTDLVSCGDEHQQVSLFRTVQTLMNVKKKKQTNKKL